MHAGLVEGLAIMRDVVIGVLQRPGQPLLLQHHDLVARGALMRVHLGAIGATAFLEPRQSHLRFPPLICFFLIIYLSCVGSHVPGMTRECPRNSAMTVSPAVTRTS